MFTSFALTALLASPLFVHAIVVPLTPGPGDIFKVGQTCTTTWSADPESNSPYKVMNIELMSGSNFDMKHITTLTPKPVDGTVSGKLDFPCPDVNPYSAIYFFQYSSPNGGDKTWTTRFTIADTTGKSVPPANTVQPGSGEKIPWGVGDLVNPSTAVAAPVGGGGADGGSVAISGNASSSASGSSMPLTSSGSSFSTSTLAPSAQSTASSKSSSQTSSTATQNGSSSTPSGNGALGMAVDMRVWGVLAGVAALISTL